MSKEDILNPAKNFSWLVLESTGSITPEADNISYGDTSGDESKG
jgi:hypothetical protein